MSTLETLSNRFLRVGRHPFKFCGNKACCHTDSPLYSQCWPLIFFFSALTDYPMPLPKDRKPGQHRDWGWLPVMIVSSFMIFIYYGYLDRIVLVLLWNLNQKAASVGYLVPFHVFILLFIITYARVVSQPPGYAKDNLTGQSTIDPPDCILGDPVWCENCQLWKPDRAHHCRVCDACVLRMDHHCPWMNGCIGVANYRFYIQFLCYVSLLATWIFVTSLIAFIQYHGLSTFDNIALAILIMQVSDCTLSIIHILTIKTCYYSSGIFTVVIGSFTLSHLWLVLINRTTIENSQFQKWNKNKKNGLIKAFTESGKNVFNQGWKENWKETMGQRPLLWFVPLQSKEMNDGVHYRVNREVLEEYQNEDQSRRNI
ncbi:hypothetical protein G6F62_002673 [Rhizopus arrhizus]|nr:hypothetical protein G6F62_002673 [Rhizopus arrhizus]